MLRTRSWYWAGMLCLLAGCGGGSAEGVIASDYQDLPAGEVTYGADITITTRGVREVMLKADSMYADEDSTTAQLFGVKLIKYDTAGRTIANVTSRAGRYNQRTQKLLAQGNVVVVLSDGRRIETEELNYDPDMHRIWSDVTTRVLYPASAGGGSSTFDTFTADDKFTSLQGTNARGRIPGLKF